MKTRWMGMLLLWTAFALRLFRLDVQNIWWDEARNIDVASRPLSAIALAGELDIHPPIYFYLLHGWMGVAGMSEFAARFLSVLPGILLVAVCYQLGRRLTACRAVTRNALAGWGAAGAAALAPFLVAEAQETRMYTWTYLWLALAGYGMLRALTPKSAATGRLFATLAPFAIYAFFSALALLTHYSAVFVLAAWQLIFVCWALFAPATERRGRIFRWLGSGIAIALLFAPQIPRALAQIGPYRNPSLTIPTPLDYLSVCWRAFSLGENYPANQATAWLWGLAFLLVGGLVLWLWQTRGWKTFVAVAVSLLVPLALYYIALRDRSTFAPRYISFVTPAYYILVGLALAGWARAWRGLGVAAAVFLLVAVIPAQRSDYYDPANFSEDTKGLTTWLAEAAGPHDLVLFDVPYPWRYYYRGSARAEYLFVDINRISERLTELTQGRQRLFWVRWFKSDTDPRGSVLWLLDKYGQREGERGFRGYQVTWYVLPSEPRFELAPALSPVDIRFGSVSLVARAFGGRGGQATSSFAETQGTAVPADKAAWVVLRWRVQDGQADYKASVILRDAQGHVVGQDDRYLVSDRHLRARYWSPDEEATNVYTVGLLAASPPGRYRLSVAVYDPQTLRRIPSSRENLDEYPLGEVEVVRPQTPLDAASLPMQNRLSARLGDLTLLGYDLLGGPFAPGTVIPLRLYWRAENVPLPAYSIHLALRSDKRWSESASQPAAGAYPTDRWAVGEVVRDDHDWRLAADVPPGEYRIVVAVEAGGQTIGEMELAPVRVEGRAHSFDVPSIVRPLMAHFGSLELLGYDIATTTARPGASIPLTLTWRAKEAMQVSYTVFVHLLDSRDQVRGQRDLVPLNGAAPTTTWLPGEVLEDRYDLPVLVDAPQGQYVIEIGFYDPITSVRLPLRGADGTPSGDRVLLDVPIQVGP